MEKLLNNVAKSFSLGKIYSYQHIQIGYEDLNIWLKTTTGKYVVKIFARNRTVPFIKDYINAMILFAEAGIPIPQLLKASNNYLYSDKGKHLLVMNFFKGKDFYQLIPTRSDILQLTSYLAKIHHFSFEVHPNYDSWAIYHLAEELPKKAQYLDEDDKALIEPIIQNLNTIDYSKLRKCVIHGALERYNVLKNTDGKYCILDLGCLNFNAAVIDLAIFLMAFCLNAKFSLSENRKIYHLVLDKYQHTHPLNPYEKEILPLLIQAVCAAYTLTPNYLMIKQNDHSLQNRRFLKMGQAGLRAFRNL